MAPDALPAPDTSTGDACDDAIASLLAEVDELDELAGDVPPVAVAPAVLVILLWLWRRKRRQQKPGG